MAYDFLYSSGNNVDLILALARIPMVLLSMSLGFIVYLFAKELSDQWGE
ncbi:hypothetical protein GW793_01380 [bacterium]|nr:hypothetical protein [bacterium]